jgi:hypothetical protein
MKTKQKGQFILFMSLDQCCVWICDEMLKFRHSSMVAMQ